MLRMGVFARTQIPRLTRGLTQKIWFPATRYVEKNILSVGPVPQQLQAELDDVDGTTAGANGKLVHASFKNGFGSRDLPITDDMVFGELGTDKGAHVLSMLKQIFEIWKKKYPGRTDIQLAEQLQKDKNEILKDFINYVTKHASTGLLPILSKMAQLQMGKQMGIQYAFCTGFPRVILDIVLDMFRKYDIDTSITVASDEVAKGRPHAHMALDVMTHSRFRNGRTGLHPYGLNIRDDMPKGSEVAINVGKALGGLRPWFTWDVSTSALIKNEENYPVSSKYVQDQIADLVSTHVKELPPCFIKTSDSPQAYLHLLGMMNYFLKAKKAPHEVSTYFVNENGVKEYVRPYVFAMRA